MKYKIGIVTGAIVAGMQSNALAQSQTVSIESLKDLGIDKEAVLQSFRNQAGVELQPNETLKVTRDEEGKNLKFETFNHLSAVVDIQHALGVGNKDVLQD